MARVHDPSWLLEEAPENTTPTGELRLWWAVIRQAAWDLRYGNRMDALDALDFLRGSGVYLLSWMFGVPVGESKMEIASLVVRRNRFHRYPLSEREVAAGRTTR